MLSACSPSPGEVQTAGFLEFTGHLPSLVRQPKIPARDTVSEKWSSGGQLLRNDTQSWSLVPTCTKEGWKEKGRKKEERKSTTISHYSSSVTPTVL